MRSMTLYQISAVFQEVHDLLIESEGEVTPEIEALLLSVEGSLEAKTEQYCAVIQELRRAGEATKAEADRLAALAKSRLNSSARLKQRLMEELQRMGKSKVDAGNFVVNVVKNGRPSIRWTGDPDAIPEPLRRVTVQFDGTAAYELVQQKQPLPEGVEVTYGFQLRIR